MSHRKSKDLPLTRRIVTKISPRRPKKSRDGSCAGSAVEFQGEGDQFLDADDDAGSSRRHDLEKKLKNKIIEKLGLN